MMKRLLLLSLAVLVIVPNVIAKKSGLRAEILHAKFVTVTAYPDGGSFGGGARTFEDARAVEDVRRALREWGRWTVVSSGNQADLIIAVRKGRIATGGVRVPIPGPDPRGGSNTGTIGATTVAEARPAEDMIAVYSAKNVGNINYDAGDPNLDTSPLWRLVQANALQLPSLPGVQQLKREIEEAEAENAKKK